MCLRGWRGVDSVGDMYSLAQLNEKLAQGQSLAAKEAEEAARLLAGTEESFETKKTFLDRLHQKGETVGELLSFARVYRELVRDPEMDSIAPQAIDIVGTGGTSSGGYNISSATALTVAASGVTVLKHGSRAVTSQSGASDFLGTLGVPIEVTMEVLHRSVETLNFCFFFAPAFHPAFKEITPVRQALAAEGKRSIFNVLGPLINPARPGFQLLGVYSPDWVQPYADVLNDLGVKRGLVVCSLLDDGRKMDELTTAGRNIVAGVGELKGLEGEWIADDFNLDPAHPSTLNGGNPAENVAIFEKIIAGEGPSGLVDTIALNAGVALYLAGAADEIASGVVQARETLVGGRLQQWVAEAREFYRSGC